ncbi:phospholipase D family protein [Roseovarius aestuariivivens]|uniref:phospholipase D family protein n=1 Tax=Roseovarius aestuariivivens TaxID=1888910 RepID=UPI0014368D00|nr:phospholipase D family protein [Roseovarius aestuariivivens]
MTQALSGESTAAADLSEQVVGPDAEAAAFFPLLSGNDALGARLKLIEKAERSIDLKTFLIKPDAAGKLVWLELYEAAARGVRIRLLFDDVFTTARDDQIATLNAHPNVELRVFNPLSRNSGFAMNFILDFKRVNRRMHNKAMIVDGSIAVIGGRNIADEYYQIGTDHEFADFDMLVAGAVTGEVSEAFDLYWNDHWSVPLDRIATSDPKPLQDIVERFRSQSASREFEAYGRAINSEFLKAVEQGTAARHDGTARVVVDHPGKLRARPGEGPRAVADALYETLGGAARDILVITPYFVPQQRIADVLAEQAAKGRKVRILTNSLASTNHSYVHGGYAGYRVSLLKAGVEFLEVRSDAPALITGHDTPLTMHTKLAVIDGQTVFAGSTNVDPRSFNLNSEIAMIVDSASLAGGIISRVDALAPDYAFEVVLAENGGLQWHYTGENGPATFDREPGAGLISRIVARVTGWLPVEGQL